jgi:Raf kinase inhibitor-like YbhB/YbcL family protein
VFNRIRRIPIEYTCSANYYYPESGIERYGEDRSPPMAWAGAPDGTESFAMVVDDPDAMTFEKGITAPRVHWVIWNIPADVTELDEDMATTTELASLGPQTRQGANDLKTVGWAGPCPPPNITSIQRGGSSAPTQKPHGYRFRIFALDTVLDVAGGATKNELLEALDGHVLAGGELKGEYVNKRIYK